MTTRRLYATLSFTLCALLPIAGVASAQSLGVDSADVRTGFTARRTIRASQASLNVQFFAEGSTPAKAQAQVALRADSVRRALESLGVARDSIITGSSWSWWPDRIQVTTRRRMISLPATRTQPMLDTVYYPGGGFDIVPKVDSVFKARENLQIRVGDPRRAGPVIDALVALRMTEISQVQFRASDDEVDKLRVELVRDATARAAEQAVAIAQASGMRLGRVVYVGTLLPGSVGYGGGLYDLRETGSGYEGGGTQVTAPTVTVTMTVYGHWKAAPPR